jgi:hypothetical protein
MLIRIANQQKLDELRTYLDTLQLNVTHVIEGDKFPMVGDFRLFPEYEDKQLLVSENDTTWMTYGEWLAKVEKYLAEHFGVIVA